MLTEEQRKRVVIALRDTERDLMNALKYKPKFQDVERIEFLKNHKVKLEKMLNPC